MTGERRPGADAAYDVVVIGAGPAGCAAAVTLGRDGRSVLVVDNGVTHQGFQVGEGAPPGLDRIVDEVFGAGTFLADDHLVSYGNRSAWGSDRPVATDFMFNPNGTGWHLDRVAFDDRLRSRIGLAGAPLWEGTVRSAVARTGRASVGHDRSGSWHRDRPWTLQIETPSGAREVDASLICDATGRHAAFARRHGGTLVVRDRLVAALAVFHRTDGVPAGNDPAGAAAERSVGDRDTTTTIEAVEGGWWYSAAIPGGRRVVAFFTDGDLLPAGLRTAAGFEQHVSATSLVSELIAIPRPAYELGSAPMVVAAGTSHLERPTGAGWLATGDAAACFDPLSSQGASTAVVMGRTAGDAAISLLVDPGAGTDAYEERYRSVLERFLREQGSTYALERRWPDAPFWSRRPPAPEPPG